MRSQERTVSEAEEEAVVAAVLVEEEEEDNIPLSMLDDKHLQTACSAATTTRGLSLAACARILGILLSSLIDARACSSSALIDCTALRS